MSDSDSASDTGKGGGGKGRAAGGRRSADEELETRLIRMNNKLYYVDVKQNWRGRYVKLAETTMNYNRRKSRVLLSMPSVAPMCDILDGLAKNKGAKPAAVKSEKGDAPPSVVIEEKSLLGDDRDYKISLKENARGRFALISMTLAPTATTPGRRDMHSQVAVAQDGLPELIAALREIGEKWNKDLPEDKSYKGPLPETSNARIGNKAYYFDYGQTARGVFMRISEVTPSWRTSITVPRSEWAHFREILEKAEGVVPAPPAIPKAIIATTKTVNAANGKQ